MRRLVFVAALGVTAVVAGGCGGAGKPSGPNTAAYLTVVRSPLTGDSGSASDADLLSRGRQACADLDQGMRSDAVVADLGGDAEPGSAAFNRAAILTAAAARELCPAHRASLETPVDTAG